MNFCDADACSSCDLAEGGPACLRRKSDICVRLATEVPGLGLRAALEKLSLDLMKESPWKRSSCSFYSARILSLPYSIKFFAHAWAAR